MCLPEDYSGKAHFCGVHVNVLGASRDHAKQAEAKGQLV